MTSRPEQPTRTDRALRAGSLVLALVIVGLSLGPPPEEPVLDASDKLIHGLAYFALTLSVLLAWVGRPGRPARPFEVALFVVLVMASGGLLVEFAQSFVSRQTEVYPITPPLESSKNKADETFGTAIYDGRYRGIGPLG